MSAAEEYIYLLLRDLTWVKASREEREELEKKSEILYAYTPGNAKREQK